MRFSFFDPFKPRPKGAVVICPNGHRIGEVVEDIDLGDMNWADKIKLDPENDVPLGAEGPSCRCATCGVQWWMGI